MNADDFLNNVYQLLFVSGILEEYKQFFEEHPEYIDHIDGCNEYLPLNIRVYPGVVDLKVNLTIGTTSVAQDELYISDGRRFKTEYRDNKPVKIMEVIHD